MNLLSAFAFFLLGVVAGVVGLVRWYLGSMKKPEFALSILNSAWATVRGSSQTCAACGSPLHGPAPAPSPSVDGEA